MPKVGSDRWTLAFIEESSGSAHYRRAKDVGKMADGACLRRNNVGKTLQVLSPMSLEGRGFRQRARRLPPPFINIDLTAGPKLGERNQHIAVSRSIKKLGAASANNGPRNPENVEEVPTPLSPSG